MKHMTVIVRATLSIAALGAGAGFALAAAAQTVGVNASVINDVRMTTQANPAIHRAVVKERVSLGNDIITGKSSILQVLLLDRTSFTVGGNARVKIDRFVYDPTRSASAVGMSVTKGAFRFMSGRSLHANPGQSSINTPVGSIGVRGTIVEGVVGQGALDIVGQEPGFPSNFVPDPATATLILLRGPGPNVQGETPGGIDITASGSTIPIDRPGYALFIPAPGQPPIGPFLLSDTGSFRLAALLRLGNAPETIGTERLVDRNPLTDLYFFGGGRKN